MHATIAVQTVDPFARVAPSAPRPHAARVGRASRRARRAARSSVACRAGSSPTSGACSTRWSRRRIRLRKGEMLFRAGEKFTSLYAIRSGSCKTVLPGEDGQRAGRRLSHGGRRARHRRHRRGQRTTAKRSRSRTWRSARCPSTASRTLARQNAPVPAQPQPPAVARDRARAPGHADAGHDARRPAAGHVPARPGAALPASAAIRRSSSSCA